MAKKKPQAESLPLAHVGSAPPLLAAASSDKVRRGKKCHVCGGEVAPFTSEDLCWVCLRLKISAWRENDNQAAMQE